MGEIIRTERKRNGLSIEQFAEITNLSISYIGLLERGERVPSLQTLLKVCKFLNLTPDELLGFKQYMEKEKNDPIYINYKYIVEEILQILSKFTLIK